MPRLAVRKMDISRRGCWGYKCGYLKKNGEYCERWAIKGHFCCPKHGGQLPVVRAAANVRLRLLLMSAISTLDRLLTDPSVKDEVALSAVKHVLQLNGIKNTRPGREGDRGQRAAGTGLRALASTTDKEIEALLRQAQRLPSLPPG